MAIPFDEFAQKYGYTADDKVAALQEQVDELDAGIAKNFDDGEAKVLEAHLTVTRVKVPLFTDDFEAEAFKSVPEIARSLISEALRIRYILNGWDDLNIEWSDWPQVILVRKTPPPK